MKIKELNRKKLNDATSLIWNVFLECEAVNYSDKGKQTFWDAIHSFEYLNTLKAYGAFEGKELLGVIATRNEGMHIALFFVKKEYQGKGVGKILWNAVLKENTSESITVHSSLFAISIYKKLGFEQIEDVKEEDGIKYVLMKYQMIIKKDCPCLKTKCKRHGHCNECRARHCKSNRPPYCERM